MLVVGPAAEPQKWSDWSSNIELLKTDISISNLAHRKNLRVGVRLAKLLLVIH